MDTEARQPQDVGRNALVSIFLRLLEYFQGILFLTTNRVETFDPAFQSRIHVALRYGDLTTQAKNSVWRTFLGKVKAIGGGVEVEDFSKDDYDRLARRNLNGRQVCTLCTCVVCSILLNCYHRSRMQYAQLKLLRSTRRSRWPWNTSSRCWMLQRLLRGT